jgi:exodeoxyribonuclease VII large subunit
VDLILDRAKRRSGELERLMKTLSHESVLERGFAIVLDPSGAPIKRAVAIARGDDLTLRFQDGDVQAVAKEGDERPSPVKVERPAQAKKPPVPSGSQGSLF